MTWLGHRGSPSKPRVELGIDVLGEKHSPAHTSVEHVENQPPENVASVVTFTAFLKISLLCQCGVGRLMTTSGPWIVTLIGVSVSACWLSRLAAESFFLDI